MLRRCLAPEENARLLCLPLMDVMYNDELWVRNVQSTVNGLVTAHHLSPHRPAKVALIGHKKDSTGFYLSLFPQWHSVSIDSVRDISATPLREAFFTDEPRSVLDEQVQLGVLPPQVANYLAEFAQKASGYSQVHDEITFIKKYREAWKAAPYPPVFVTVDAVVIQSGHILLIERRASPGKGLWALPGGFVDQGERLLEACLRELREETRLKVPTPVLKGSIRQQGVYDAPYRSARGEPLLMRFISSWLPILRCRR